MIDNCRIVLSPTVCETSFYFPPVLCHTGYFLNFIYLCIYLPKLKVRNDIPFSFYFWLFESYMLEYCSLSAVCVWLYAIVGYLLCAIALLIIVNAYIILQGRFYSLQFKTEDIQAQSNEIICPLSHTHIGNEWHICHIHKLKFKFNSNVHVFSNLLSLFKQ